MKRNFSAMALCVGLLTADAALAAPRAVFLLDRSGSMSGAENGLRASGNSRCYDAWYTMVHDMETFFIAQPTGTAAVVYFGRAFGGVRNVTQTMFGSDFVGEAQATAALASLNPVTTGDCMGFSANYTPLADGMCQAFDLFPPGGSILDKQMWISSDGGENNSSGACSGPSNPSATPPFDDPAYWQGKVLATLNSNFPPPLLTIRFWEGSFPLASQAPVDPAPLSMAPDQTLSDTAASANAMAGSVAEALAFNDREFFESLVTEVGGEFIVHNDNDPQPTFTVPAVSTWGLLVLSLTLLVGAKVYFNRKHAPQTE